MSIQTSKTSYRRPLIAISAVFAVGVLAASLVPVAAQSGGSKETQKLRGKVEAARKAVEDTKTEIRQTMVLYNSLVAGEAAKPEPTYKKLIKGVDSSEKSAKSAGKAVESMHKDIDKFFAGWAEELDAYSSDSLRAAAQESYDEVKGKLDRFDAALKQAADIYHPFINDLKEQTSFMGRDLSPEAMTALQDSAKELNAKAEALFAKIDEALNDTQGAGAEAEAAEEAHDEGAAAGADDETGDETEM
jgi:hypothetical protein